MTQNNNLKRGRHPEPPASDKKRLIEKNNAGVSKGARGGYALYFPVYKVKQTKK